MTAIAKSIYPNGHGVWNKLLPFIEPRNISIIIPVKNNQKGVERYLNAFLKKHEHASHPKEIIFVDNGSEPPISLPNGLEVVDFPVRLVKCSIPGPAAARNAGVRVSRGDWLLFNDSDCIPTQSLLTGYIKMDNGSIAYAGNVKPLAKGLISNYCGSQEILVPLAHEDSRGEKQPLYIITANALVLKEAFLKAKGFNEAIQIAGGEDIDFGLRLSWLGKISFALESNVLHDFSGGVFGFLKRFVRYGYGNRLIEELWEMDLRPKMFQPNERSFINITLAKLQFVALYLGYIRAKMRKNRIQTATL